MRRDLEWLGVTWEREEKQSDGFDQYNEAAERLREAGDFLKALAAYRKAEKRARQTGDEVQVLTCRLGKGHCLRLIGRFRQALSEYRAAEALARALLEVLTAPERADVWGAAGRQRALDTFGEARLTDRIEEILADVVAGRS